MKLFTSFFFTFFFGLCSLAFSHEKITLSSEEKEWISNNVIKIGINSWEPLKIVNKSNTSVSGIDIDRLNIIIERFGLNVEYQFDTFDNLIQAFKNQQIDLIPSAYYTKKRAEFGLFTRPYMQIKEYLYVQEGSSIKGFIGLEGKTLAIVKGYGTIEKIKSRFPNINIVETKSLEESIGMVLEGSADALFDLQVRVKNYIKNNLVVGIKGVAQTEFEASPIHFFINKEKPILQRVLQKGLNSISLEGEESLTRKWLYDSSVTSTFNKLTVKERAFISKKNIIKMCNNSNWMPIEFKTNEGEYVGMSIDTLRLIEKKLPVRFQTVHTKDWEQSQQFLKEKKCDILACASKTPQREEYALFTKPYLSLPLAIFTQSENGLVSDLSEVINKPWSRKKGSGLISNIKQRYPESNVVETKDNTEALKLVSSGDVFFTIATLPMASYAIKHNMLDNIHIAGYTDMQFDLSVAVRDDMLILRDILDKALADITQKEHNYIFQSWVGNTLKEQVFDYKQYLPLLFVIALVVLALIYRQYILKQANDKLQEVVEEKVKELQDLNQNLTKRVHEELERNRYNELQLLEQSKMAAMGDMIGNIAHQWRQPLSVISTASTGLLAQKQFGSELSDESLEEHLNLINDNAQYLSNTIDTFRDYIKEKKVYKEVILQDRVKIALNIVEASLSNNYIKLIHNLDELEPIPIKMVVGELSEVIINIINNAKDILKEKKPQDPWIKVELRKGENKVILSIEDNGGGIPDSVMPKIFDPYFTTKHQSIGTGLGLHMAYKIITESLHGKLKASNTEHGAKFIIELDLIY